MELFDAVFLIAIIMFSAVIHEVMHGVVADRLGDPTARYAGRLTLNPIPHLDPFGSVLLPIILALTHSPVFFAWAKPVPYNPYNLRPGRFSEPLVAFAGPASNLVIALVAGLFLRSQLLSPATAEVVFLIVVVNVMLFMFNLIPVPPLDGSKALSALLPRSLLFGYERLRARLEYNPFLGMGLVLLIILFLGGAFGSFVYAIARAMAGV
jgi:Zn-dependent protease